MSRFFNLLLIGSLALACSACRSFPGTSSSGGAKNEDSPAAAKMANRPAAPPATIANPYQPVFRPGYFPQPAPGEPATMATSTNASMAAHGAACPCGRAHGMSPHANGCMEAFRFHDEFPVGDPDTQWAPDGIARPWPHDEYLWDGGDRNRDVRVKKSRLVTGLDMEDTIVHYDTYSGKTEVSASNRVPIYAPRFAAVRHIISMEEQNKAERIAQADKPLEAGLTAHADLVTNLHQPAPAIAQLGVKKVQSFRERNAGLTADHTAHLLQTQGGLEPYENFKFIAQGILDGGEKPRLAQMAANAVTWIDNKAVQVVIDGQVPLEAVRDEKLGETILYDRKGQPQMRICKIADRREAQPGDIVKFTLRFDNIGDEKVDKVVIIDNLTTRLEYVAETQQCSHPHKFITTANDGETLILRWELDQPLRAGEGGIIRFHCRVR